ncbi:epoxide hydrolase 4-like isoform X2 [Neocloeon triangulifer]|uniref:epoxide hydrolase 4-like isoform X2 n=1 Tax=Neocloeon triangulifer TaxID=2078957 RepID=UPI00286EEECF|nr:epoxide hydrolase 4-like isoform X2 [Neocloeon triangulifer]
MPGHFSDAFTLFQTTSVYFGNKSGRALVNVVQTVTPPLWEQFSVMFRTKQMIKQRIVQAIEPYGKRSKHEPCFTEVSLLDKLQFYSIGIFWALVTLMKIIICWLWNPKKHFGNKKRDKPAPTCLTDSSLGTHSYIKLKGVKFHYVEAGNAESPLMICLHGFLDCWIGWRFQMLTMAQHFRVVAVDLKGFGDSEKPQRPGMYKVEQIVKELAEFTKAIAGENKKCVLVGHDMGALVGWFFVYSNPDLVARFVSISCPHPNIYWEELLHSASLNKKMVQQFQVPDVMENMLMMNDLAFIDTFHAHVLAHPNSEMVSRETYKFVFSRKVDWTGALNYFRTFWKARVRSDLVGSLDIPLLLIVGDKDQSFSMETAIKSTELEDKLIVRVVGGAGHAPHQEAVHHVNKLLLTFLAVNPNGISYSLVPQKIPQNQQNGLVNRMFGAISSTYTYGNQMLENVTRKSDPLALPYRNRGCTSPLAPR